MKLLRTVALLLLCLLAAACGETTPAPTPAQEAAVTATAAPLPTPTTAVEAAPETPAATPDEAVAAPAETDWLIVEGKTEENLAFLGNPEAPVTLVDYSDFLWTACRSYVLGTEPQLREAYVKSGQVKLVFYPMVDFGDPAFQLHQAAMCAGEQGKFWPLHDLMFERQRDLFGGDIRQSLQTLAGEIGLDLEPFTTCLDEQRYAEVISGLDEQRRQAGIRTRPTFDINGQLLVGAQGFEAFQNVIEPLLAQ